jgi:hypothetical protein
MRRMQKHLKRRSTKSKMLLLSLVREMEVETLLTPMTATTCPRMTRMTLRGCPLMKRTPAPPTLKKKLTTTRDACVARRVGFMVTRAAVTAMAREMTLAQEAAVMVTEMVMKPMKRIVGAHTRLGTVHAAALGWHEPLMMADLHRA